MKWILVTGSRELRNAGLIADLLAEQSRGRDATLVVGDNVSRDPLTGQESGADHLAVEAWTGPGNPSRANLRVFRADWKRLGRRAGPARNHAMIDFLNEQQGDKVCLAFYQTGATNRGTAHCANAARSAGLPVHEIWAA